METGSEGVTGHIATVPHGRAPPQALVEALSREVVSLKQA